MPLNWPDKAEPEQDLDLGALVSHEALAEIKQLLETRRLEEYPPSLILRDLQRLDDVIGARLEEELEDLLELAELNGDIEGHEFSDTPEWVRGLYRTFEYCWIAVLALGEYGIAAQEAVPSLISLLYGMGVRSVSCLRRLPNTFRHNLLSYDCNIRIAAAKALGKIGPASAPAAETLCRMLEEREPLLKRAAARALGDIGSATQSSLPSLAKLLRYDTWEVRSTAADAIARIGLRPSGADAVIRKIIDALREERNAEVLLSLIPVIGNAGHRAIAAVPILMNIIQRGGRTDRRIAAVEALGRMGSNEPADLLETIANSLEEPEPLRQMAREALTRIQGRS